MAVVTVDFDGTLYQGDSFKVMFQVAKKDYGVKEWSVVGAGLVKSFVLGVVKGKTAFKHEFFRSFARSFKGKTQEELAEFFDQLARHDLERVNYDLVETVKQHQNNGDDVVVLSGALMPFLKAFTREVGLTDVETIGTQLVFDSEGVCRGQIGRIVNGDEKVEHLQNWLKSNGRDRETETLYAYADSETDEPLFQFVDYPYVVNPDERLKQMAVQKGWFSYEPTK
ncbi:HAD family hydrolase [Alkalibacillus almallahensis]|uniref:HAD family hydrolase n=1 Tax=Alkalibacillus almallahensis TaxID=1379154 RepID=UPI00142167E4|nr:HAD-IB family hydrolase [Alkalibacillus almallahensis]NIK11382.1 HAD superfamily hydrolase (TIGR01490 family) [Alkalibacillus almallahensis]